MAKSFQEWGDHFARLYGERNKIFLPSIGMRLRHFYLAYGDVSDAVRVRGVNGIYPIACARLVARAFALAEHYGGLPIVDAMRTRFGPASCGYCGHAPCDCPDVGRPDIDVVRETDPAQAAWSLGQWQRHLDELYGRKNAQHGIQNILGRLIREQVEFQSLVDDAEAMCHRERYETVRTIQVQLAHELADVFAWILALATALGVDIEVALEEQFGSGCKSCREMRCRCTTFEFRLSDWKRLPANRQALP